MTKLHGDAPFPDTIDSVSGPRGLYRTPVKTVAEKKLDHLEPWATAMIEAARFAFMSTADRDGRPTVSPKGGTTGFVSVLDERHLVLPDYPGNNLLDSLENIVENPTVGLIFLIPGRPETFRVNGDAWITTAPEVLGNLATEGRRPKTAIGVRVVEAFFHCPASFQRAGLWDPDTWDADNSFDEFIRGAVTVEDWPDWARE
jgi:hypothetical protein